MEQLASACNDKNLSLNVDKTEEMVVDFRRTPADTSSPLFISGSTVEMIRSTKFLGVNIADDLTWSLNTNSTKKAQQRQHFQWRLKRVYHHPSPPPSTEGL